MISQTNNFDFELLIIIQMMTQLMQRWCWKLQMLMGSMMMIQGEIQMLVFLTL